MLLKKGLTEEDNAVHTDDFYYDLTDGGYIKPDNFLEPEDAQKVKDSLKVLTEFKNLLEHENLLIWL